MTKMPAVGGNRPGTSKEAPKIAKGGAKAKHEGSDNLAFIQVVARELSDGRVRGSLTSLAKLTSIGLDSLRVLKRDQTSSAARKLAPPRLRLLAILVAAHRVGMLDVITESAVDIEREWQKRFPKQFS